MNAPVDPLYRRTAPAEKSGTYKFPSGPKIGLVGRINPPLPAGTKVPSDVPAVLKRRMLAFVELATRRSALMGDGCESSAVRNRAGPSSPVQSNRWREERRNAGAKDGLATGRFKIPMAATPFEDQLNRFRLRVTSSTAYRQ